jgi:hypothetical protein
MLIIINLRVKYWISVANPMRMFLYAFSFLPLSHRQNGVLQENTRRPLWFRSHTKLQVTFRFVPLSFPSALHISMFTSAITSFSPNPLPDGACPAYNTSARIAQKTPLPTILLLLCHVDVAWSAQRTPLPSYSTDVCYEYVTVII